MHLHVNGESRELREPCSVAALVEQLGLVGKRLAVELNGEILPRSIHAETALKAGDRVEIVQAIGGG